MAAPASAAMPVPDSLLKIRTIGELRAVALESAQGEFVDYFKEKFKGHEKTKIEIRRNGRTGLLVRLDRKTASVQFLEPLAERSGSRYSRLMVNGKEIEIDWQGEPNFEFKKIEEALPKSASAIAVGRTGLISSLVLGPSAEAVTGLEIAAGIAIVSVVSAVAVHYYGEWKCNRVRDRSEACVANKELDAKLEADPNSDDQKYIDPGLRRGAKGPDNPTIDSEYLRAAPGSCKGNRDKLVSCLKERGFDVGRIVSGQGTASQMCGTRKECAEVFQEAESKIDKNAKAHGVKP